jgi:hypothetical protein
MAAFDEAVIDQGNGTSQRMSPEQFFKLPLVQRVKMLCDLKVRFFKAGRQVSAAEAMK